MIYFRENSNKWINSLNLKPADAEAERRSNQELSVKLDSIKTWMTEMQLKLNSDETEFIQFGGRQQLAKCQIKQLEFDDSVVELSRQVKYRSGALDQELYSKTHIVSKSRIAMINLLRIRSIW